MSISLIYCKSINNVIGDKGKMPWSLKEDMQMFRKLTENNSVIMGRKTYESVGKKLPGRRNVNITSQNLPDVEHYHSIEEALVALASEEKVFVIGGGEIYKQTIERADELLLTIVENDEDGDTFFPSIEELIGTRLKLVNEIKHEGFTFLEYKRISISPSPSQNQ